jgi:DNA polymerase-4
MMDSYERTILHVDIDSFFASVERRENPLLRGKPVAVGGHSTRRGVIASASYEAKARGVTVCMPYWRARELCPEIVLLPCDMEKYVRYSASFRSLLNGFSDLVEPIGMDEAFVDITRTMQMLGDPEYAARRIRERISLELGIPASVGIAGNKTLAKVATRMAKPAGVCRLDRGPGVTLLQSLPVATIDGIGHRRRKLLEQLGIRTVRELSALPRVVAGRILGADTSVILERSRGNDDRPVAAARRAGISRELTFDNDQTDASRLRSNLLEICERLSCLLKDRKLVASEVSARVRYHDFREVSRSSRISKPTSSDRRIYLECIRLISSELSSGCRVRLIGAAVGGLAAEEGGTQLDLMEKDEEVLDRAIGAIRERFGWGAISRASVLAIGRDSGCSAGGTPVAMRQGGVEKRFDGN